MGWWQELSHRLSGKSEPNTDFLNVDGIEIKVVRKAIKNVNLRVYPPLGHVKVAVPLGLSDRAVKLAIAGKLDWIRRHQIRLKAQPRQTTPVFTPVSPRTTNRDRRDLRLLIPSLIQKWEPVLGVKVAAWGIKKMRTRWGSCNTRAARIWLNLALVRMPAHCLEYVVVHEMVHLLERRHNKRFHALMNQHFPEGVNFLAELNRAALVQEPPGS